MDHRTDRPAVPFPSPPPSDDPQTILARLAARHSIRDFLPRPLDADLIDAIIGDGLEAPSACNHQMWHFVVVRDQATKDRLQAISGSNEHFSSCGAIILLCFHMGWNHNKFAVVQSVAAATYHMSLSAHLRGLGATWNAGIGNGEKIRALVGLPADFEVIGTLCLGWPAPEAPDLKPPRRPLEAVRSYERFARPEADRYPLAPPSGAYRYTDLMNHRNKYSVFDPDRWGWDRIANFRSYAVYAKSPLPGVYVSRRLGAELEAEVGLIGPLAPGARLVELLPYGGSYTVRLRQRYGDTIELHCLELSTRNLDFVRERVRRETGTDAGIHYDLMSAGRLPYPDGSVDVVFLPQILEAVPDRAAFLDEVVRVLRPGGRVVVSVRNLLSWFGLFYFRSVWRGQVPNFGPYRPLASLLIRRELDRRCRRLSESGLSPLPNAIARPGRGLLRLFSRLYAGTWVR
ncbi:MAG: nitroreductase family protein [Rhodospirillaceae bacterium]